MRKPMNQGSFGRADYVARRLALLAVAAVLAAAGCDAQAGNEAPQETSPPPVALWDPCTLSDSTLQAAALDPSTRDTTIAGAENVEGWELCSWKDRATPPNYSIGVWATTRSLDELKSNEINTGFTDVTVAGRQAVQHGVKGGAAERTCYLRFPTEGQVFSVSASKAISTDDPQPPCDIATAAAEIIASEFPQ